MAADLGASAAAVTGALTLSVVVSAAAELPGPAGPPQDATPVGVG
jgi:hypothetical protein